MCNDLGVRATALPMDGFHFSKAKLRELDPPDAANVTSAPGRAADLRRRGLLRGRGGRAKDWKVRRVADLFAGTERPRGRAESCSLVTTLIVLCEGNYLLLGKLDGAEAERWRPLDFDESWFVRPQGGVPEQRDRVVERHLETWTDEKTAAWGAATAREGAEKGRFQRRAERVFSGSVSRLRVSGGGELVIGVPLSSRCEPVSRDPHASLFVRLAAMACGWGRRRPHAIDAASCACVL